MPYFVVRPKDLVFDGKARTLLWGYGGFEVSYTASYNPMTGRGWLQYGAAVHAIALQVRVARTVLAGNHPHRFPVQERDQVDRLERSA